MRLVFNLWLVLQLRMYFGCMMRILLRCMLICLCFASVFQITSFVHIFWLDLCMLLASQLLGAAVKFPLFSRPLLFDLLWCLVNLARRDRVGAGLKRSRSAPLLSFSVFLSPCSSSGSNEVIIYLYGLIWSEFLCLVVIGQITFQKL